MKRSLFASNSQRTLIITFIAVVFVLFHLHRTSAQSTALASLAASMQPGTWAELQTSNLNATFSSSDAGGGASGQIIGYTDDAVWDPASRQVFFLGGDHNWSVPTTVKFVSYSEATNSWQRRTTPSWASGVVHGYHHNAIDTATGTFYHRPFSVQAVHRYNISAQTWDQPAMAAFPFTSDYNNCCDAFEYFPELGGLVWVSGSQSVYLYRPSTNQWSTLATNLNIGGTWHSARYNPVRQVMIFYSEMTGALYKLSSSGQVTRLGNPPISLYNSLVGPLTVDPVSGKYLALTPSGTQFYTYDVQTDVWQAQSTSTKPSFDSFIVATPISTYGVNMFVSCASGAAPCHVYLYKFSGGSPPPPPPGDTTPPTVSVSSPAAGSTVSATTTVSANASDNVGVAGVQFKLDGANLGAEDTTSPYSVSWNTTTASNGSHTLTAVARDAAGNQATSASVTVTVSNAAPTFDFSLANGGNRTAVQGQSASNTVTATLVSGTAASVSFSASGLPSGATASFSPASCLPTCTSTLPISTSASTPSATSTITVTGTSGSLSHTTAFTLTVSAASSTSSFTQKCAQSGVLNCFSFDSTSSLFYAWPTGTQCDAVFAGQTNYGFGLDRSGPGNTVAVIQNGQCVYPQIDTTNTHSGAGSLKFTIPSNSSANSSGYFAEPFKRYADGTFPYIGPGSPLGSVVYFQFYQKVDPNFVGIPEGRSEFCRHRLPVHGRKLQRLETGHLVRQSSQRFQQQFTRIHHDQWLAARRSSNVRSTRFRRLRHRGRCGLHFCEGHKSGGLWIWF
ncbi:MAG: hypothetical protein DMG11_02020 [Acidobacteria bacterium]|nr:MAG: hypothetical protein DMG11_02020 [Acidobacteriota bacterium]